MSQEWATVKLLKLVKEAYEQIKAKTKQNWPLHLVVLYVKAADNCNSSSINCNYEKSFGNEILRIDSMHRKETRPDIQYHS